MQKGRVQAFCCSLVLVSAGALSTPLYAQNLVTNPNFNTNLNGWGNSGGATFDSTNDANGSLSSGSARWAGTVAIPSGAVSAGVNQCITITGGNTYDFGGKVLLTSAPAAGSANVIVSYYSDGTCNTFLTAGSGTAITSFGTWQSSNGTLLAPASANSALIQQNEHTNGTAGDFTVNFDDMFLQLATPVPTMPLPLLIGLAVMLALTGSFAIGRLGRARS